MALPQTYQNSVLSLPVAQSPKSGVELNKLFEAAVVSRQFCQLLLSKPEAALQQGYLGNTFDLTLDEKALIVSIQANSLPELAKQVISAFG
jgi:hypothetical protein